MHKKRPKVCTCCRVNEAKFYFYHSTKIAKARPGFDDQPEYPSVQINSSSPCLGICFNLEFGISNFISMYLPQMKQSVSKFIL